MSSKIARKSLVWGGFLILLGSMSLVERSVEVSPWAWAAAMAIGCLGALGLYLVDRSDEPMLLLAYVLGAIAGLLAVAPSGILRDEAVAVYALLAVALPFFVSWLRDRGRRWALIPGYLLLVVTGVIGFGESGLLSDDLISAYVALAGAVPFFVIYGWDRGRWWALIPGVVLTVIGLSLATWLSWHDVRSSIIAGRAAGYLVAAFLLLVGASILVRAWVGRGVNRAS